MSHPLFMERKNGDFIWTHTKHFTEHTRNARQIYQWIWHFQSVFGIYRNKMENHKRKEMNGLTDQCGNNFVLYKILRLM
jgi:hypothetical protein